MNGTLATRSLVFMLVLGAAAAAAPVDADIQVAQLQRDLNTLRQDVQQALRQQRVALDEATRAREELFEKQTADLQAYGDAIRKLAAGFQELAARQDALTRDTTAVKADQVRVQNQLAELEKRVREAVAQELGKDLAKGLAQEQNARQTGLRGLEDRLVARLAVELNRLTTATEAELKKQREALDQHEAGLQQQNAALAALAAKLPPPRPPPVKSGQEYTVQKGDTLSTIAKAFGVTVPALMELNQLPNDVIRTGQNLKIPVSPNGK